MQDLKGFIMFLTIAISIYVLTNLYVYIKGSLSLSITGFSFWVYTALFIIVAILFPLSFFLRHTPYCGVCTLVTILGSIWLGAMFYFFLIGVLVDGVRLIDFFFHVIPTGVKERSVALGRVFFVASILIVTLICTLGYRHSVSIKLKEIDFAVKNLPESSNPLSIVFLSDVHIGVLIRENRLEKIIAMTNEQRPDLILIGGDLLDESEAVIADMEGMLSDFRAKHGVFAVLGNHECYLGPGASTAFMERVGIRVLRNEVVTVPGMVNIVGFDDPACERGRAVRGRVLIDEVLQGCDPALPTILLFHTPVRMDEFATGGVDLMLSGHTHKGQFFPFGYVTDALFRVGYGTGTVGGMHVYVSSGAGTWGPPMRVLSDSEIVKITLTHKK
jgi:predicted MPP superfamily phosphohydrolase